MSKCQYPHLLHSYLVAMCIFFAGTRTPLSMPA